MTDFAMVQNHTLQHFAIYPSSSTEEFGVFFFFLVYPLLPLTCRSTSEMTAIFCGMKEEKRGKETPKKKKRERERFKSEKSRKQCQFVYKQN